MAAEEQTEEKSFRYFRTGVKVLGYFCVFLLGLEFGLDDDGGSPEERLERAQRDVQEARAEGRTGSRPGRPESPGPGRQHGADVGRR